MCEYLQEMLLALILAKLGYKDAKHYARGKLISYRNRRNSE